jgi:pantoate--beta-alanine ligase
MEVIRTTSAMQDWALGVKRSGKRIGFVPTMGYLHKGHMSLVRLARERSDVVVASIFVNPIQFLPNEDLASYPRDFERDERLCREAETAVVFYPAPEEMYAPDHSVYVDEIRLSKGLCGRQRPGHFKGVVTVVAKLFNVVLPDVAVFGQKDAQQTRVIQRLVRDLNFPVEIVVGPIVREPDGLAMSSRNRYLSASERHDALALHQALALAEDLHRRGSRDARALREAMQKSLATAPAVKLEFIEIVENTTLEPVDTITGPVLVALAARVGATRLIDNTVLGT